MNTITKSVDAFGHEMWDFFKGKNVPEIIERDDGYIDAGIGSLQLYFSDYKDWGTLEKAAVRFVHGHVLDVGCGAGRHCLYLQKKGYDVMGIDNSPLAIKISGLRGVKKTKVLPFENINKLQPKKFDTILMLGNNFGLFESFNKARVLLKKTEKVTTDKALIIATLLDPYDTDNKDHRDYHKRNRRLGRMGGQIKMRVRKGKLIGKWFDYLYVSKKELEHLLSKTGWKVKKFLTMRRDPFYAVILEKR